MKMSDIRSRFFIESSDYLQVDTYLLNVIKILHKLYILNPKFPYWNGNHMELIHILLMQVYGCGPVCHILPQNASLCIEFVNSLDLGIDLGIS